MSCWIGFNGGSGKNGADPDGNASRFCTLAGAGDGGRSAALNDDGIGKRLAPFGTGIAAIGVGSNGFTTGAPSAFFAGSLELIGAFSIG